MGVPLNRYVQRTHGLIIAIAYLYARVLQITVNPPFAGDISAEDTLSQYDLAYKPGQNKRYNQVAKEILFIERCLKMLVPLGRMAIVLPRGLLKNYSDERVRQFILKHAHVLGVVGLGGNMFKPFTNTKTVILFLQKRLSPIEDISSINNDYRTEKISYCVTERSGKDRTGKIIIDSEGNIVSDLGEITEYMKNHIRFISKEA